MVMAGECAQRTAELALRAAAKFAVAPSFGDFSVYYPARCLVGADRLDEAQDLLAGLLAAARRRGDDFETIVPLAYQAELALRRGDLAGAEADVRAALALTSAGWVGVPAMAAVLAAILLENERLDEARSILGDAGITGPGGGCPRPSRSRWRCTSAGGCAWLRATRRPRRATCWSAAGACWTPASPTPRSSTGAPARRSRSRRCVTTTGHGGWSRRS
jgi:hypothetical protein